MKRDLFIVVNPAAGGGHASRRKMAVAEYLRSRGRVVEIGESRNAVDVREQAARAAAEGYACVIGLGGDGTFHYVAEAVCATNAVAGLLPAGNGNDVARALGIPRDPIRAADVLLRSQVRKVDLLRVQCADGGLQHCVCTAGLGLDAEAAYLANTRFRHWPGVARYLAGAASAFSRRSAFDLHAEIDGAEWRGQVLFAVVANAGEYGAGIRISPAARMDDGWLELVLVHDLSWTRFLEAIPILLTSGDLRWEEIERFRCKRVRIEALRGTRVHGDGEILGEAPAEFEVVPGVLRVIAPSPAGA